MINFKKNLEEAYLKESENTNPILSSTTVKLSKNKIVLKRPSSKLEPLSIKIKKKIVEEKK